jgi:predicted lipid-binding transport protein (Tim44 family)
MSERGDIWLSRGFSVTCILSAFIGALMVGVLLGEPDLIIMLFGAVGGVMVGAVIFFVVTGVIRFLFGSEKP